MYIQCGNCHSEKPPLGKMKCGHVIFSDKVVFMCELFDRAPNEDRIRSKSLSDFQTWSTETPDCSLTVVSGCKAEPL